MENKAEDRRAARKLRELYGLTQAEVAAKASVITQSELSLYEEGFVDLPEKKLQRLEKALNDLAEANQDKPGFKAMQDGTFAEKYASWSERRQKEARRSLRRQAGLTQIRLARETGIPRKKLIYWEDGRAELSDAEFAKWQQALIHASVEKRRADPWSKLELRIRAMLKERRRWLPLLEKATSIDDPIIAEIIESFRREIAELEQQAKKPVVSDTQAD
jgi:transcriptional regulator with XRE-family HTH domain